MDLDAFLALLGVLLTALTTIPIIRELAGHQERATVSLAREVISGQCGDYERDYWTNAMNDALKRIEAKRAYPALRGIITFGLYAFATLVWAGSGWLLARSSELEQAIPLAIALVLYVFGITGVASSIFVLYDIRAKRAEVYAIGYSEKKMHGYGLMLYGLAVYFHGISTMRGYSHSVGEGWPLPPILNYAFFASIFATGLMATIMSKFFKSLGSKDRADEHIRPRPYSRPSPRTWKTVRRYLVVLFILDWLTRKRSR